MISLDQSLELLLQRIADGAVSLIASPTPM
jgi:hypothetical protein